MLHTSNSVKHCLHVWPGVRVPDLQQFPLLCRRSAELCHAGHVRHVAAGEAALYVAQREMALVAADGSIAVAGSDRATTCHVAILRHVSSGTAAVAHIDTGHSGQMSALVDTVGYIYTLSTYTICTHYLPTQYLHIIYL